MIWTPAASLVSSSTIKPCSLNHSYSALLAVTEHNKPSPNLNPLPEIHFLQLFLQFYDRTYSDLTDEPFYKVIRLLLFPLPSLPSPPIPSQKYHYVSSLCYFSSITFIIIRHVYLLVLLFKIYVSELAEYKFSALFTADLGQRKVFTT